MTSFFSLKNQITLALYDIALELADFESEQVICWAFGISKARFLQELGTPLDLLFSALDIRLALQRVHRLVLKRRAGTPLAYLFGQVSFMGHSYAIQKGVLIPRPETELLVDACVRVVLDNFSDFKELVMIEFGFGSGVVSIELALRFHLAKIFAWDISKKAYGLAQKNALVMNVQNITWICKDFFRDQKNFKKVMMASQPFLFVSNPPYVSQRDMNSLPIDVKGFEPKRALYGGVDGLNIYRKLFRLLKPFRGVFLFEIGYDQKTALEQLAESMGYRYYWFLLDYQQIPRIFVLKQV